MIIRIIDTKDEIILLERYFFASHKRNRWSLMAYTW